MRGWPNDEPIPLRHAPGGVEGDVALYRDAFLPGNLRYHPRWRHALGEQPGAEPQIP